MVKEEKIDVEAQTLEEVLIVEQGKWYNGILSCFDNIYPSLVCSVFTPGIYLAQMLQKLTDRENSCAGITSFLILGNLGTICLYNYDKRAGLCAHGFMWCSGFVLASLVRTMARKKMKIPGSQCEDTFMTVVAGPLSTAQVGRTVYEYKKICDNVKSCENG